jgi:hypothetical protein
MPIASPHLPTAWRFCYNVLWGRVGVDVRFLAFVSPTFPCWPPGPGPTPAVLFETSNLPHRLFKYVEIMLVCGRSRLEPYAPVY